MSKWMARFWGNRSALLREATPENLAKLEVYKNTEVVIVDELGETLLPRQPIYNPRQPGRP